MSWEELLNGLWAASLSASIMILMVLLLRMLFQSRTPRRVFCLLWDAALLRLLIPGSIPSPLSVWRWLPASAPAQEAAMRLSPLQAVTAVPTAGVTIANAAVQADAAALPAQAPNRTMLLAVGWLTVALMLLVWFLWSHLRFRRACADSLPCENEFVCGWLAHRPLHRHIQVRTSDRIAAPLTYGILHPIILLPSGMKWTDSAALSCILEHEFGHIRHFDTLRKALLAAAVCLHWFNPLVWVLYRLSGRDMELNCDEAVTARGVDRVKYAQTLLDMEEERAQWGLSGSHFSQNALEERIRCMMKHRKNSIAALAAVLLAMIVTVTAFASGAPEDQAENQSGQDALQPGSIYSHFAATEGETIIRAEGDARQYSLDGGKTWMSEEDYRAQYGESQYQVEWWTAEEYAAWLEEEKQVLQSIIGERGYTGADGWFTWDQARVDEAVARYERILEDIQSGALYSKSVKDGNGNALEEVALAGWTLAEGNHLATNEEDAVVAEDAAASETIDESALLEELQIEAAVALGSYQQFGLSYEWEQNRDGEMQLRMSWNGKSVHSLYDTETGVWIANNLNGTDLPDDAVDLETVYEEGVLTGLRETASGKRGLTYALGSGDGSGTPLEAIFDQYQPYGLGYAYGEDGQYLLTWNGQAVASFADVRPDGSVFSYQVPHAEDGVRVYTEYDEAGMLAGLKAE